MPKGKISKHANRPGTKLATEVDQLVGQRIRELRLSKGLSQTALADACHITFQQVQKYEKGVNRVSPGRLMQIGTALGVTAEYFFAGASPGSAGPAVMTPTAQLAQTPRGMRLARDYLDMSNRMQEVLGALAEVMANENKPRLTGKKSLPSSAKLHDIAAMAATVDRWFRGLPEYRQNALMLYIEGELGIVEMEQPAQQQQSRQGEESSC